MKIVGTEFDLNNNALWVYISGCKAPHCENCHNKSLWEFTVGKNWKTYKHKLYQHGNTGIVKRFFIAGGEPLDQDNTQLELLLNYLSQFNKPIMLWTRYELHDIPKNILQYCNYAKTGYYDCDSESYEEPLFGITLGSLNQKIIKT